MKHIALILTVWSFTVLHAFGQTSTDTITVKKVFGGYNFYQGSKRLTVGQLVQKVKPNELAFKQMNSARTSYAIATVLSYAGGFMIGFPIGTALGGGKPDWTLAGIGAGLIVVALPFNYKYNKKAKQAVEMYNSGIRTGSPGN